MKARADLLQRRAYACYLIGEFDDAIETQELALDCRRRLGDRRREGDSLRSLSRLLRYVGRTEEAMALGQDAVAVLEPLPPSHELGMAYCNLSHLHMHKEDSEETSRWSSRAMSLAEELGDDEVRVYALTNVANMEYLHGKGFAKLEECLRLALEAGLEEHAGRAYLSLAWWSPRGRHYAASDPYVDEGLEYCTERGLDLWSAFLLAHRARSELDRGRWDEALRASAGSRREWFGEVPLALVIESLVLARRGEADAGSLLDQALESIAGVPEGWRHCVIRAALAEAAWLRGDRDTVLAQVAAIRSTWWLRQLGRPAGELALWAARHGEHVDPPEYAPQPIVLELAGDWRGAIRGWRALDAPYEAALAALPGDERAASEAMAVLRRLGATATARAFSRTRAEQGARLPRGPRPSTLANAAGLTRREQEVLTHLARGTTNAGIADALHLSKRTVAHHVSAILSKLDASTRTAAVEAARTAGLLSQDGPPPRPT
jgi:DNA-binding CsgD family transcriptional regulator/tetratricopeptide (TPR) repeat protein